MKQGNDSRRCYLYRKGGATKLVGISQRNNVALLEEGKAYALVDSTATKSANLKEKFLFYVFAFCITQMERKAANLHEIDWEAEMSRDWLRCVFDGKLMN